MGRPTWDKLPPCTACQSELHWINGDPMGALCHSCDSEYDVWFTFKTCRTHLHGSVEIEIREAADAT